jgi:ATP-dependent exoDNAse (exonuclease V) alpha subunit
MQGTIELNEEFTRALQLMDGSNASLFITGKAGTGKSTLLSYFIGRTRKNAVVLAPTGVAALNVGGETIHSFFGFKPGVAPDMVKKKRSTAKSIYQRLDTIIIDEVSMVRADLLDCVDRFLRLNGKDEALPFGGVQMIFVGDLYQLPPVVTEAERPLFNCCYESPYFFSARSFKELAVEFVELKKIYRQTDEQFIHLLNRIRNNQVTTEEMAVLNRRAELSEKPGDYYVYLATTNKKAAEINDLRLGLLDREERAYTALASGEFDAKYYPTEYELRLKAGSQVMLLNNDPFGRWVNGSIGRILGMEYDSLRHEDVITVELTNGKRVEVSPYKWEIFKFRLNEADRTVAAETAGHFVQYPMRLAWAVTIHKSQGKTFERVVIDVGRGTFAHGQVYVALSRCTSLDGIVLKSPLRKEHIIMDRRVVNFLAQYATN